MHKANQSPMALTVLNQMAELYGIEAEGKDLSIAERQRLRFEKSLPTLSRVCMPGYSTTANGGSGAKALDYSLMKRWPSLSRYAETGYLPCPIKRGRLSIIIPLKTASARLP